MTFPFNMLVILLVCAVLDAVGFKKFVYFMSVGYGFSVASSGIALLVLYRGSLTLATVALCGLLVVYGVRLGGFLLLRELKNAAYRKTLKEATGDDKPMPVFVKAAIWVCCCVMYVMQTSPVLYRMDAHAQDGIAAWVGVAIMALALVLETLADKQKSAAKAQNPNRFCDTGLYKIVRCPNYLGELLFWTGVLVSGAGALQTAGQWAIAVVGYLLLVYVMFSGAKRLEGRQTKNYGNDPEFLAYVKTTPILLPGLPLYSLLKFDFIK